ncbi:hypothetical protein [Hymenobacter psychrotolerans]|uniref:Lipocalin-like domain-containing protein n=1 Tax=Hymenobacter psychrotolerans DSM 18569 TaxID=1121959 RepID=A0A1M6UBE4_9BACT|nr:hypothetical protein [Hymenobacter psychrotolerans]SHK66555.1 hypothetical protein SAMN02746009_01305 [Hymenobacter psychrotolerans DSM 18569]
MKKVTLFLSLAATVLSLASCEKELDNVNTPDQAAAVPAVSRLTVEEKTSLLTSGDWKLTSMTASSGQTETNLLVMLKADERDNLSKFQAAGKFVQDEGAAKRTEETPQESEGVWAFSTDGSQLSVTNAGTTTQYDIADVSASSLTLTRTNTDAEGKTTIIKSVYAH